MGVERVIFTLPSDNASVVMPELDRLTKLVEARR